MSLEDSYAALDCADEVEFVAALHRDIQRHPAVQHPYLKRIAKGDLTDVSYALRDYACQYAYYADHFPRFLEEVTNRLLQRMEDSAVGAAAEFVTPLLENLAEERGDPDATDDRHLPHRMLFARFQKAIRVQELSPTASEPCSTVVDWCDAFMDLCTHMDPSVGIGALGLATELVVPDIYGFILEGIQQHTALSEHEYIFFSLHVECDAHHAADMEKLATHLAVDRRAREGLRQGVGSALELRLRFWDTMLQRAIERPRRSGR